MAEFHFLRPGWLAALPVMLWVLWLAWRAVDARDRWQGVCDPDLAQHLLVGGGDNRLRGWVLLGVVAQVIAVVAMAGPSFHKAEQPLALDLQGRVVLLDLSPSMNAVDAVPSRLQRARGEVLNILRGTRAGQLGLVVFSADAFVVAPMTRDVRTLAHLLAALDTGVMPRAGARPDLGIAAAGALLSASGVESGDVIYIGDSGGDERAPLAARSLRERGFAVSVLAVGSARGGPIRLASGRLALDSAGNTVVQGVDLRAMREIARAGGGRFERLGVAHDAAGFEAVQSRSPWQRSTIQGSKRQLEQWQDEGPWLLLLLLPVCALAFRRGWLLVGIIVVGPLAAPRAQALEWEQLWWRAEQRVAHALRNGPPARAVGLSDALALRQPWRAVALYNAGRFAEAARALEDLNTPFAHYNRGNALAAQGELEAALTAYEKALRLAPEEPDALHNWKAVARALRAGGAGRAADAQRGDGAPDLAAAGGQGARGQNQSSGSKGSASTTMDDDTAAFRPQAARAAVDYPDAPDAGANAMGVQAVAGRLSEARRRNLERVLARISDDPRELLRRRFAIELDARAARDQDTGAAW